MYIDFLPLDKLILLTEPNVGTKYFAISALFVEKKYTTEFRISSLNCHRELWITSHITWYYAIIETLLTEAETKQLVLWENLNVDEYMRQSASQEAESMENQVKETNDRSDMMTSWQENDFRIHWITIRNCLLTYLQWHDIDCIYIHCSANARYRSGCNEIC